MDEETVRRLIDDIRSGATTPDEAVAALQRLPFVDVGDALVDHHRALRQGMPEAVYGPGKTAEQCLRIVDELLKHGAGPVLLTRASDAQAKAVLAEHPNAIVESSTIVWRAPQESRTERVLVVSAGTADVPVVDDAVLTLRAHGFHAERLTDVGVAGLHRLLAHLDVIIAAEAIIVVAGMEGALASVIGGLTAAPVVAVPTSVGYGSSLDGVTALLAMHASCASGVTVVGIDNGFGAACAVVRMFGPWAVTRTAWFHCFAGTAGDMTMGALVHAGADVTEVMAIVGALPIDGYALTFEPVLRCGIAATHAIVAVDDQHDHRDHDHQHAPHRPYRQIRELLDASHLPPRVLERAQRTFRLLAEVEGRMHRMDPDDVEFHEVGAVDAIVDVVGACAALEVLGIDHIVCSPITVGQGHVHAAHGQLPNPAPAVVDLLALRNAPSRGIDDHRELATPTGVALMVALADQFGPMPAMNVAAVGYGAGTRDVAGRPNAVQVVIGDSIETSPGPGQPAELLECNVDDVTGEVLAHTITQLLAAGAHDAWATPIVMKKGRPAHTVHALCDPALVDAVRAVMVAETGTLGVRGATVHRWPQQRDTAVVDIDGHAVRVKVAAGANGHQRFKVEHDDAAAAAAALGVPLRVVMDRAQASAASTAS